MLNALYVHITFLLLEPQNKVSKYQTQIEKRRISIPIYLWGKSRKKKNKMGNTNNNLIDEI